MYKLTVFRDMFGRLTLVCSRFDQIAEGPDSFCHHCIQENFVSGNSNRTAYSIIILPAHLHLVLTILYYRTYQYKHIKNGSDSQRYKQTCTSTSQSTRIDLI